MARREVIQYFDDIEGTPLGQDEVNIVNFGLDGTNYIIDLSEKNATKFRELLAPFLAVARKEPRKETAATSSARRTGTATQDSKKIREWGRKNGYDVAERGKLPADLIAAYRKASGTGSEK